MRFGNLLTSSKPANPMLAPTQSQGEGLEDDRNKLAVRDVVA
jgi:hypothetical protein